MPRTDEHVVNPPAIVRLPNDRLNLGLCIRIVDRPGVAGSLACYGPRVMLVHAVPAERLEAAQIPDTGCVRAGIEVAGNDGGQDLPVTGVELRQVGEHKGKCLMHVGVEALQRLMEI